MLSDSSVTARLLEDTQITTEITRIIGDARQHAVIVSPYVDRVPRLEQSVVKAIHNQAAIKLFVRKDDRTIGGNRSKEALKWFREQGIEVIPVPNLHAKFYMNEKEAVVTSMNLLQSSWSVSHELGFLVDGDAHAKLVRYMANTLRVMSTASPLSSKQDERQSKAASTTRRKPRQSAQKDQNPKDSGLLSNMFGMLKEAFAVDAGYCIRCGDQLSFGEVESDKVLCAADYKAWARYRNDEYEENFCTTCGKKRKTSYAKPQCRSCYQAGF